MVCIKQQLQILQQKRIKMMLKQIKEKLLSYDYKGKTKQYFKPLKYLKFLNTWKFWRVIVLIMWVIGIFAPFIGLGAIQAFLWAFPAGMSCGIIIAEIVTAKDILYHS